ncbi:hypothetical protein HK097_004945 [Rhizophlyctis rosea]|uniref:Uncharacterized protein n=1 Tax=Rhizophlyctis rosea TaxID=64517 RepID=A0AAD5SDR3_9FUNG|nr:hypothetical protein HK097_004945 [Rhizophlyctis rosea]
MADSPLALSIPGDEGELDIHDAIKLMFAGCTEPPPTDPAFASAQNVTTLELGFLAKQKRTGCSFVGYDAVFDGFGSVTVTFAAPAKQRYTSKAPTPHARIIPDSEIDDFSNRYNIWLHNTIYSYESCRYHHWFRNIPLPFASQSFGRKMWDLIHDFICDTNKDCPLFINSEISRQEDFPIKRRGLRRAREKLAELSAEVPQNIRNPDLTIAKPISALLGVLAMKFVRFFELVDFDFSRSDEYSLFPLKTHAGETRAGNATFRGKHLSFYLSRKDATSSPRQYPFPIYATRDRTKHMVHAKYETANTRRMPSLEYEVEWAVDEDKVVCMAVHVKCTIRHWIECLKGGVV